MKPLPCILPFLGTPRPTFFFGRRKKCLHFFDRRGECKSCRSHNILQNERLVANIGADTTENGPCKVPTCRPKSTSALFRVACRVLRAVVDLLVISLERLCDAVLPINDGKSNWLRKLAARPAAQLAVPKDAGKGTRKGAAKTTGKSSGKGKGPRMRLRRKLRIVLCMPDFLTKGNSDLIVAV